MFPVTRKEITKVLKEKQQQKYKSGIGAHYEKMFIQRSIDRLESSLEFEDGRKNMEYLIGIKVKKIGPFYVRI
jgi:hypothetical protein